MADTLLPTPLDTLNLFLAGLMAGRSALVCSMPRTPLPPPAWSLRKYIHALNLFKSFCVASEDNRLTDISFTNNSMCEEVPNPKQQVPKALVGTVIMNTTAGLITLTVYAFVLPDLETLVNSEQPVPVIVKSAVGNSGGAFGLLIPLIVLAIMCGIGCTTAASRVVWAFSRDGGIPGSLLWRQVNNSLQIPFNAMMLSMMVQLVLGAIYFGSATAFNSFSAGGIICLTISYATPITVSLFRGRKDVRHGAFYLGRWGTFCNVVTICSVNPALPFPIFCADLVYTDVLFLGWSLLAVPLFCMPTSVPVTANSVNYASVVFVGFILLATVWYFAWGKKNYKGPPTVNDHRNED